MNINDKIKQILIDKNLTPSYFADEIGVQRSSISHILSGRNRPSFDIIQKIIRRFPDLGYEWIMEEDLSQSAPVPAAYTHRNQYRAPVTDRFVSQSTVPSPQAGIRSQRTEIPPVVPTTVPTDAINLPIPAATSVIGEKKVERILIFYSDGSFREYTPST